MKRAAHAVAAWAVCVTVGYGLTVVSPTARHVARTWFVWSWRHLPAHGYRLPTRFADDDGQYQVIQPEGYPD
jgi:hypothetical protein